MIRLALLAIHTMTGLVALVLGVRAAVGPPRRHPGVVSMVEWAVGAMVVSLAGLVFMDWPSLASASRVTFAGFTVIAVLARRSPVPS